MTAWFHAHSSEHGNTDRCICITIKATVRLFHDLVAQH